jgi:hypothetical protein
VEFSGRYVLRAEAEGYAPAVSPPFDQAGEGFVHDFKLVRANWIQGVVRLPGGQPAANTAVLFAMPGSEHSLSIENGHAEMPDALSIRTTDDGRFQFSPPGKPFIIVALHAQGYAETAAQSDGPVPDLILTPWAQVEGEVRVGSKVGARETVELQRPSPFDPHQPHVLFSARASCDESGHFLLDHVPAGDMIVGRWICENQHSLTFAMASPAHVQTKNGETAHILLGGTGRPVIGRLVVPAGIQEHIDWSRYSTQLHTQVPKPKFPDGWQTMTDDQRRAWFQQWMNTEEGRAFRQASQAKREIHFYPFPTSSDGTFRVEDMPPGDYELNVSPIDRPGSSTAPATKWIGQLHYEFTIPQMPGGRSDEPLDLGDLELKPLPQGQ